MWFAPHFGTMRSGRERSARSPVLSRKAMISRDIDARHPRSESREDGFGFEPRHHLTDAAVNADAKTHMSGDAAGDVELIGALPSCLVAIGGSNHQQHFFMSAGPRRLKAKST
jgi:hypothetical protein